MLKNIERAQCSRWMEKKYEPGLVSVIIPTYNSAQYLADTLNSVYAQTYRPIEIIVIDDGSTDNTKVIVKQWKANISLNHKFELHYYHQENAGAQVARNLGLKKSRGEYIQFLDSDDLLSASKVSKQVNMLSISNINTAILGQSYRFRVLPRCIKIFKDRRMKGHGAEALGYWIGGLSAPIHSILWRRIDLYSLGPWDEALTAGQDREYTLRFLLEGGTFRICPQSFVFYRMYNKPHFSISGDRSERSLESRLRILTRLEKRITQDNKLGEYREALSQGYYKLARISVRHSNDVMHSCLKRFRELSPNQKIPGSIVHRLLDKCLGLTGSEKILDFIRYKLGIRNMRYLYSVADTRQLFMKNVPGPLSK